jgi:outer membrane protein assembly factor BamB
MKTAQLMRIPVFSLLCLILSARPAGADDWPNWRGPNHNGISAETGWLDHWPADGPPIAWKAKVGIGFCSFAVAGGRVFTAGNEDNTDTVFCFDAASGKSLWTHPYKSETGENYFEGGPTSTPTVDGDRVFTLSRWGDLFCFEAATGKIVWSKNVHDETGIRVPGWGFGGSPLVHDNLLVLNVGEAGLALDKSTGKILWRSADKDAGYSTPLPFERAGRWLALIASGTAYQAMDLKTGKRAWQETWLTQYGVNASDPILEGDRMFLSTGYGKGAGLFNIAGASPEPLWQSKVLRNQFNSSVLLGGFLYGIDGDAGEKASLKCVELATGTEKWKEPNMGSGALIAADGKLIVLSARGELLVAPASPTAFTPTARAQVLGGKCWTTPVLASGRIYCRNAAGDLVCLDARKAGAN